MSISMSSKILRPHCGQSFLPIMSQNKRWQKSAWHQVLWALWPIAQHPANWFNLNFRKWWPNTSSFVALYSSSCQIQALMSYSTYWSYLYSVALLNLCLVGECALAPGRPDPLKGVYALLRPNGRGSRRWRADRLTAACGGHASSGMNGAHFRTLWAAERRIREWKKSVVGIKPNGSCYFFSFRPSEEERRKKRIWEWDRPNVRPSGAVSSFFFLL